MFENDVILNRGVVEIIDTQEFIGLLNSGTPLKLKMGFDPSAPDIHLGHVVGLRKLRQLQDLGHQVILIVGDWTAQIGDPSGQSATRRMLDHKEVEANAETYLRQFFRIVDKSRTQVVWQSEWFGKFTLADVIRLSSQFTVAQFLQREDFRKRWDAKRPIAITELLYPLLQAYDSVMIRSDVEFGGTDQKFNLLVGRQLQEMMGQRPQQCFLVPMLVGTDGVLKMSKSLGNYIGVDEKPLDQYGKIMSLGDDLIPTYFELLTDLPVKELNEMKSVLLSNSVNPMILKKRLAKEIVIQFWGETAGDNAENEFGRIFQQREIPQEIQIFTFPEKSNQGEKIYADFRMSNMLVNSGITSSLSEAKRLVRQGAIRINDEQVNTDILVDQLCSGITIKIGKRRFLRLEKR
jgi:tyrosyl-tRNA synthetase